MSSSSMTAIPTCHIMLEYIESIITADQVKKSSLVNKTI